MKLSKLFHTLYATVMALPVLVIPIFALNILHKETEPISIEVQENVKVDNFNQQVQNGNFVNANYWSPTISVNDNVGSFTFTTQYNGISTTAYPIENHVYFLNIESRLDSGTNNGNWRLLFGNLSNGQNVNMSLYDINDTTFTRNYGIYTMPTLTNSQNVLTLYNRVNNGGTLYFKNIMVIDLTQIYGSGNEPTANEFVNTFNNSYYNYGLDYSLLLESQTITYNDTDIGSQFIYALYKPVHDYFNFGDFFGLGGMYDWFTLNIFNGTAPLSFFIVFNVMIYWLFISLFWLIFDILIYVPMVIHKWLDKAEM